MRLGDKKMAEDPIKTTVDELKKLINVENFIGEPLEFEGKIVIPFMKWGLGFGAGGGSGTQGDGGHGAGSAIGIEPISVLVIDKNSKGMEGVRVLNLTTGSENSRIISELGLVATDLIKEVLANLNKDQTPDVSSDEKSNEITDAE